MIPIHISDKELWDDEREEFVKVEGCDLVLEHSLIAVSEWESKYHKSFIDSEKTTEEMLDYFYMMILGNRPSVSVLKFLTQDQIKQIMDYINDPITATTISKEEEDEINDKTSKKSKFTTSEEIYSWMCAQQIPFECQYWHLNRLIILIKLCALNNKPKDTKKKKMTSSDLALRRARMEAARKKYGG